MNKSKRSYTLHCEEEHLDIIAIALEMYSRMMCGQLGKSYMPPIEGKLWELHKDNDFIKKSDEVEYHFNRIKEIIWGLEPNASHGVGYDEDADFAYEIYKTIRHQFELDRKENCDKKGEKYTWNVHSSIPLKQTKMPFIQIETTEKRKLIIEKTK